MQAPQNVSRIMSTTTSNISNHLSQQVSIADDLFQQHQHKLSKLEQAWITNAIRYARHTIDAYRVLCEAQALRTSHHRLPSLHLWKPQVPQSQSHLSACESQFLIAMQDLNSAMNMLSWCARSNQSLSIDASFNQQRATIEDVPESELSRFLNRGRVGRRYNTGDGLQPPSALGQDVENTIIELKATNSLLCSTNGNMNSDVQARYPVVEGRLPLSLVETVEKWRQSAEDALKAAMRGYFEREEMLKGINENTIEYDKLTSADRDKHQNTLAPQASVRDQDRNLRADASPSMMSESDYGKPPATETQSEPLSKIIRRKSLPTDTSVLQSSFAPLTSTISPISARPSCCSPNPNQLSSIESINKSQPTSDQPQQQSPPSLITAMPTESADSAITPRMSPFSPVHSAAHVSVVSLTSTHSHEPRYSSFEIESTSAISLPRQVVQNESQHIPLWQQPESRSSGIGVIRAIRTGQARGGG